MMTSRDDHFKKLGEQLDDTISNFMSKSSTFSAFQADLMKVTPEGDMSVEEIYCVVLNPRAYKMLEPILPILHDKHARAVWLKVLEETLEQIEKDKTEVDNQPE